jgi:hypothetical protein
LHIVYTKPMTMSYDLGQFVAYLQTQGFMSPSAEEMPGHQFLDKVMDEQVTMRAYLPLHNNGHVANSSGVRIYLLHKVSGKFIGETAFYEWTDEADLEMAIKLRLDLIQEAYMTGKYASPLAIQSYMFRNGLSPFWLCRNTGITITDEEWRAMQ